MIKNGGNVYRIRICLWKLFDAVPSELQLQINSDNTATSQRHINKKISLIKGMSSADVKKVLNGRVWH